MSAPTPQTDVAKRTHIRKSLLQLSEAMPNDALRSKLDKHIERLNYSAPELLDQRWQQVHAFLTINTPDAVHIQQIWNDALAAYPI